MRSVLILASLLAMSACAGAVQGDPSDSSFYPPPRSAQASDSARSGTSSASAATESTGVPGDEVVPSTAGSSQPETAAAASRDPVTQTRTGRFRTELLQDKEFRMVFGDVQRLNVVLDFHESRWGLLKVLVGPGFETVSSAAFNLEHLYRAYKAVSYYSNDVIVELWKDGTKIGEVSDTGLLIGPDYRVPRDPF
jgi:hypothetical protein